MSLIKPIIQSVSRTAAALLTLAVTAGPALAVFPGGGPPGGPPGGGTGGGGGGNPIPEIGLGAAASALTLLVGLTLIALDRRRRAWKAQPEA